MSSAIRTIQDLDQAAALGREALYPDRLKILIGSASCGVSLGARQVEEAAKEAVAALGIDASVTRTGCFGFCASEPVIDLMLPHGPRICYHKMTPEKTRSLLQSYVQDNDLREDWALCCYSQEEHLITGDLHAYEPLAGDSFQVPEWFDLDFFKYQKKVILRNCGTIDPMSIEEALARGAYRGVFSALTSRSPEEVVSVIEQSGLRGRGGASFPTGLKWSIARKAESDVKYVICNADEGAPAAYMDRNVLEGDPHAILEGMLIGAYAIGASEGYIYIRSEYPLAIEILLHAIDEARARGLLGEDIFESGFSFNVKVRRGAGAYVCGEETALIESLEGRSGEPRTRPPYPVTAGLHNKPTVVNNVKTWASVAPIVVRGSDWYCSLGTENTSGTTIFSLEGMVRRSGLVEAPFGMSLGDIVNKIGGGIKDGKTLKAIQAGGPSRGCVPPSMLDLAIDTVDKPGETINMGTGGIVVLDRSACMVDMARFLLDFFVEESCGKCTPCREGGRQMVRILTNICRGSGTRNDLDALKKLAQAMKTTSVCGLGTMAPNPVLAALNHFEDEFIAHIDQKQCVAGVCNPVKEKLTERI